MSKTEPEPKLEKTKDIHAPSPKKVGPKPRADQGTKVSNTETAKASPTKNVEQKKDVKSPKAKSGKPINPIELIDELQGIEDFLRESTNESPKKTETKGSPKKPSAAKDDKSALEKSKSPKNTASSDNNVAEENQTTEKETTKLSPTKPKSPAKTNSDENKSTVLKRKLDVDSNQMPASKASKTDTPAIIIENTYSLAEKTEEVERVFVAHEVESDESKVTDGKCGNCANCKRKPCFECSCCKREDFNNCIDVYCLNQRDHRDQRQAMRELYLQARQQNARQQDARKSPIKSVNGNEEENCNVSIQVDTTKKDAIEEMELLENIKTKKSDSGNVKARFSDQGVIFEIENTESESDDEELSMEQRIDKVMARITKNDKLTPERLQTLKSKVSQSITKKYSEKRENDLGQKERKKNRTDYVYGGSSKAKKVRRCGECEGCTRDDCGKCIGCLDKPKFGGKNTRKQACTMRKCRMK